MKLKFGMVLYIVGCCWFGSQGQVLPGAYQTEYYIPLLKDKRVAVFANQTSTIGNTHLVDSMMALGINVVKIFGPEHGFRGTADAGEHVKDGQDARTGIKVISLYGNHKKPTADDLSDVDVMVFDIQDVGVRFYTFISSLEYYIEAAAENNKPLIILDRPNPNGHYVDGPVLDVRYKSFVGMQPIPIVYGMTVGEYAYMLVDCSAFQHLIEYKIGLSIRVNTAKIFVDNKLLNRKDLSKIDYTDVKNHSIELHIITNKNYTHKSIYNLPIAPSPNLKQMQSIYWYPSTCFFEGTVLSEGRGTDYPFQIFGHPSYSSNLYAFTPNPNAGAKSSKLFGKQCFGWYLGGTEEAVYNQVNGKIQLKHLIKAYKLFPNKDSFFIQPKNVSKPENYFFNKLAGNDVLMYQLKKGWSARKIRKSWSKELNKFKSVRRKYLLYN
jgi:uncharacterized protein YbbC (DUF1343 family)